ncbi:MAG: Hsp20/alpha crystallin family protein [Planctomycetes bacterium]|nr:Hsp20/alpha crystallin family protein [Planctomycetota bacterium]
MFFNNRFPSLLSEIDQLFSEALAGPTADADKLHSYKEDDALYIEIELPGLDPEAIDIHIHQQRLHIKAQRVVYKPESARVLRNERDRGVYDRSIQLPSDLDTKSCSVTYQQGILRFRIAVAEEHKPIHVQIEKN